MTASSDPREDRLRKLERLRELGVDPFGSRYPGAAPVASVRERFEKEGRVPARIAGRILRLRGHGKAAFLDLEDRTGRIQVYVRRDAVGEKAYEVFKAVDLGDLAGVEGPVDRTQTGEVTLFAETFTFLTKALRPLPEKFHGLTDTEIRYRKRYLDLITNDESRAVFLKRARIVSGIRRFLDGRGFVEVETPVLQPIYGGASARPFVTHHNTLNRDLYLRIADELYLKRLLVGGLERVYELSKNFRNEGIDRFHNPEFTFVECYQAFGDLSDMMDIVENLVFGLAMEVNGTPKVAFAGQAADLTPPWKRLSMLEAIRTHSGVDVEALDDAGLRAACAKIGIETAPGAGRGALIDEIFSRTVEHRLVEPTFLVDYPVETTPLARRHPTNPRLVQRFEPFVFGMEIGNAFTELNDPIDQRARLSEQQKLRESGDVEAQGLDEDFVEAMEHGMPPAGGLGMGVDRLVMILTGAPSIRDVILFPQMRD
ncbi:MAG: lysine--tRNA ligase [Planctomycetes bacterium]|jgi:lysyl-tRNA synthetase class 2|nr:lysine--tRNA ligase [Planctomycetota bacterium]